MPSHSGKAGGLELERRLVVAAGAFHGRGTRLRLKIMAIDPMVHLVFGVRRAQRDGKKGWDAWVTGREEQWRGIVYSDVVIAAGFAIFALSNFPPTQRFGLVVVSGTIVDIMVNLFLLPLLAGAEWRTQRSSKASA